MSRLALRVVGVAAVIALLGVGSYAVAGGGSKNFSGSPMTGYEENPDISTVASRFVHRADVRRRLVDPLQAQLLGSRGRRDPVARPLREDGDQRRHLILALRDRERPVAVASTPTCPSPGGTVEGDITAADVIGPGATGTPPTAGQGIEAGNLAEILAAMRAGHAYANVHSTKWPGGEIRAQIDNGRGHGDHDNDNEDDD